MLQKRQLKPARALKQHRSRLKNNVPFLRTAEGYPDLCHGDGWPISTRASGSHFPFPSLSSPLFLQPFQPHATPLLHLLFPPPPRTYSPFPLSPPLPSSPSPTYTYIDMYTFMYVCLHICVYVCINGWGSLPLLACVCFARLQKDTVLSDLLWRMVFNAAAVAPLGVVVVLRGDRPHGDVIATTPIASFASMRSMTQQKTCILSPDCGDTVASPGT